MTNKKAMERAGQGQKQKQKQKQKQIPFGNDKRD
jgi:hypothetical protein